jgi:hypothetical protein
MALTKCKECGNQLAKSAKVCPHCGAKPRRTSGCSWLVLIAFVFGLYEYTTTTLNSPTTTKTGKPRREQTVPAVAADVGDEISAEVDAKIFVKKMLKAPRTAKFPGMFDPRPSVSHLAEDELWIVSSYVDAQNVFGAMLRNEYVCVMKYKKRDQYECVYLKLGDEIYGTLPEVLKAKP